MFGFFKKKNKHKQQETLANNPTPAPPVCTVSHIKRIDVQKYESSSGDGEYSESSTTNFDCLDIVRRASIHYVVRTKSHYYSSYDRYESPMNTESQRTTFEIHAITPDMIEWQKDQLLGFMEKGKAIWGECGEASSYVEPLLHFVEQQVERALKRHADELRIAEKKKAGDCIPNAVLIPPSGPATPIYIDDFTPDGLAAAMDCDRVTMSYMDTDERVGYFYDAKIVYGRPYNAVASAMLGAVLEGNVITCARGEDGSFLPLEEQDAIHIAELCKIKQKFM